MTLQEYKNINNSFKHTCVFRIGTGNGFLSEINNMILAMIFCLEKQVRFQLYSAYPAFCNDLWKDFFVPFTKHPTNPFHRLFNHRQQTLAKAYRFDIESLFEIKKYYAKTLLTQDVWCYMHDSRLYTNQYDVDTPFLSGKVIHVGYQIIQFIWNYNSAVKKRIEEIKSTVHIDKPYAAIHIRRGDKHEEADPISLELYFNLVDKYTQQRNFPVFIASDDHRVMAEAKERYPDRSIYHFNFPDNKGFDRATFTDNLTKADQVSNIIGFLAELEMLVRGDIFVGTFSSNIGMFVGMARNGKNIYGVDYEDWLVW